MSHAQVPASAPLRGLRLLCLLVNGRDGETRYLPIHTMRALSPRLCPTDTAHKNGRGKWGAESSVVGVGSDTGLYLRETHAVAVAPEVLARCLRQRQTHTLRPHLRAI